MERCNNPKINRTAASDGRLYSLAKVCLLLMFCGAAALTFSALDASPTPLNSMPTVALTKSSESASYNRMVLEEGTVSSGTGIRQISVLGERNSGTRWTFGHVSECFNHSIKVTTTFTRYKHWFQFNDPTRYRHKTLVIAQFRNPYTWLKAMQKVPHHSPVHVQYRNDWKKFLSTKWTMERIGTDRWPNQTEPCQQFFDWKDIRSCQIMPLPQESYSKIEYSNDKPFYEMRNDGSGEPYDNIMDMRSDKIRNFLSVKSYEGVADAWYIRYEHLLRQGTKEMIDNIAKITGVEPKCKPFPAQNRQSRPIEPEMVEYINTHLNWTVEDMIGYAKENP